MCLKDVEMGGRCVWKENVLVWRGVVRSDAGDAKVKMLDLTLKRVKMKTAFPFCTHSERYPYMLHTRIALGPE